jgi:hypothetical protein
LLGSYDISTLNSFGSTGIVSKQLTVPCSISAGTYNIIAKADGLLEVDETNEYNNVGLQSLVLPAGQSAPVIPVITASGSACSGNMVTLTASSAGCTNCTYNWNNGTPGNITNVVASGNYVVTATNSCGAASSAYNLVFQQTPNVNYTSSAGSICSGSTVTFNVIGASSYVWSGPGLNSTSGSTVTATPAISGILVYQVVGTTNGCKDTLRLNISVTPTPVITVSPSDTAVCSGSSVTLNASGATNYIWSPSTGLNNSYGSSVVATPTAPITYTVIGLNNTCADTANSTITVGSSLVPSVSISYTGCPGNNIRFTATPVNGGGNPQYEWYVNNVLKATLNSFLLNNATNGMDVYVKMTSNSSCASIPTVTSPTTTLNCIVTAIPDVDGLESFHISPNPSNGRITIHMKLLRMKTISFTISDGNGKIIKAIDGGRVTGNYSKTVDLSGTAGGVYYLRTMIGSESFVEKMVIVR